MSLLLIAVHVYHSMNPLYAHLDERNVVADVAREAVINKDNVHR